MESDQAGKIEFLATNHVRFVYRHLRNLPSPYAEQDNIRVTLAYFCLSSLALLPSSAVTGALPSSERSALEIIVKPAQRARYIDWIYAQQAETGAFRGSDSLDTSGGPPGEPAAARKDVTLTASEEQEFERLMEFEDDEDEDALPLWIAEPLAPPNLIQSYTALLCLGLLSDDYKRLNWRGLLEFMKRCQNEDGSFSQFPGTLEVEPGDPRSTYAAFAICSILDDWSAVNVDSALDFLKQCQGHEGAFATLPHAEPQGKSLLLPPPAVANRCSDQVAQRTVPLLPSPSLHDYPPFRIVKDCLGGWLAVN